MASAFTGWLMKKNSLELRFPIYKTQHLTDWVVENLNGINGKEHVKKLAHSELKIVVILGLS